MPLRVGLVWLLATVLWSSTFLFIKVGLRDIPPFTFAWVRLSIAAVVLGALVFFSAGWRGIERRALVDIAAAGLLLLGVNYALVFWGAQFVPSGLVAILQAGTPVIALIFGWLLGSERVTPRKAAALIIGVVGVIVIFGAEARASNQAALAGAAAVFAGSICVAFAYVWIKTRGHHVAPSAVATVQSLAGLIPLAAIAFVFEGAPAPAAWNTTSWLALLYLALLASVVAFWLNYWLLRRMDTSAMLLMGVAEWRAGGGRAARSPQDCSEKSRVWRRQEHGASGPRGPPYPCRQGLCPAPVRPVHHRLFSGLAVPGPGSADSYRCLVPRFRASALRTAKTIPGFCTQDYSRA